jgi:hypothetical protein
MSPQSISSKLLFFMYNIMKHAGPVQYSISVASLVIVTGLYFALHPLSERLLSPLPNTYLPVIFITALVIAIFNSITLLSAIPLKLVRRLGNIFLLAVTLYALGESERGFYAKSAFEGTLTTHNEEWFALHGDGKTITLISPQRTRSVSLVATPEAAAVFGLGKCVTLMIETAKSGAERIATVDDAIAPADVKDCKSASFDRSGNMPIKAIPPTQVPLMIIRVAMFRLSLANQ